jgi:hypothetical protein
VKENILSVTLFDTVPVINEHRYITEVLTAVFAKIYHSLREISLLRSIYTITYQFYKN